MSHSTSKSSTGTRGCSGRYELVTIGVSSGGVNLLMQVLPALPADFAPPVLVCLHAPAETTAGLALLLDRNAALRVKEAEDKEALQPATVYLGPGGYHLHVERDRSCSLSIDPPEKYARPSIDVLFDSAALACRERLLAVILSGANDDGADGVRRVKACGGTVVVQDPADALIGDMPRAALQAVTADYIVKSAQLAELLVGLCSQGVEP